jgi:hypothetical protein
LPKVSPKCKFYYGENGLPATGKSGNNLGLNDDLHMPAQLRYRAKDLKKVEPFDVAHPKEPFCFKECPNPLVVSPRFYQFCVKKKYTLYAIPVRIDAD